MFRIWQQMWACIKIEQINSKSKIHFLLMKDHREKYLVTHQRTVSLLWFKHVSSSYWKKKSRLPKVHCLPSSLKKTNHQKKSLSRKKTDKQIYFAFFVVIVNISWLMWGNKFSHRNCKFARSLYHQMHFILKNKIIAL